MYKVGKVITKEWTKGNSAETFIFVLGNTSQKKINFFRALPKLPPPLLPPIRASCTTVFRRQKRCLAFITEPSNGDYDNDVSDNCDHNFGTFDDFGVKNDQKVSHNMIY